MGITDDDLIKMNKDDLQNEVMKLREAIRYHRDQRGDENCWLDDKVLYDALPEKTGSKPELPDKQLMMINCSRYYDCRKKGKLYVPLDELPKNIEFAYNWVDVKLRLPPYDTAVVVINREDLRRQCIAYNQSYNELVMTRCDIKDENDKRIYREVPFEITHWYPLPWWPNADNYK